MVKTLDYFYFRNHLCITFELLSLNLYEFIKNNNFQVRARIPETSHSSSSRPCMTEIYLHCILFTRALTESGMSQALGSELGQWLRSVGAEGCALSLWREGFTGVQELRQASPSVSFREYFFRNHA